MESVVRDPLRRHAILVLWMLLAACSDDGAGKASGLPAAPGDWQTVESSCGYRFRAPGDLVERPVEPLDSCVEVFESGDCRLIGDVGAYAPDLDVYAGEPEHRSWTTQVGGRPATVLELRLADARAERPWVAALAIADVLPDNPDTTLVLWIACASVAGRERLTPLLGTVELVPGAA
jgi:hypothetical protein